MPRTTSGFVPSAISFQPAGYCEGCERSSHSSVPVPASYARTNIILLGLGIAVSSIMSRATYNGTFVNGDALDMTLVTNVQPRLILPFHDSAGRVIDADDQLIFKPVCCRLVTSDRDSIVFDCQMEQGYRPTHYPPKAARRFARQTLPGSRRVSAAGDKHATGTGLDHALPAWPDASFPRSVCRRKRCRRAAACRPVRRHDRCGPARRRDSETTATALALLWSYLSHTIVPEGRAADRVVGSDDDNWESGPGISSPYAALAHHDDGPGTRDDRPHLVYVPSRVPDLAPQQGSSQRLISPDDNTFDRLRRERLSDPGSSRSRSPRILPEAWARPLHRTVRSVT